jgi:acetyltransferase-like isoleucine patch superfamily enzyme
MKTTPFDFLLCSLCILLLVAAAAGTVAALSPTGLRFSLLLDVAIFLLAYGLYTALLLNLIRLRWPYPTGRQAMDSTGFTLWKLNAVLVDLAMKSLAPFRTVFTEAPLAMLWGARVGSSPAFGGVLRDHPLLSFGDYCTIGQNSVITAHAITHDYIYLAPVRIGNNAVVGIDCTVMPGVTLGDNAVLAPGAVATTDTVIPANELWGGIPARKIKDLPLPIGT